MSSPLQPEEQTLRTEPARPVSGLHPIQLEFVSPRELTVRARQPANKLDLPEGEFNLSGSVSPIDTETRRFQASAAVVIGDPSFKDESIPLYLRVDLVAGFIITDPAIEDETAIKWAAYASQFTLLPYLRTYVASLSASAGFTPIMLPLIQLPPALPKTS